MLKIKKAVRRNIPVKLLLQGMPGSGKTMSALRVGRGLVGPEGWRDVVKGFVPEQVYAEILTRFADA